MRTMMRLSICSACLCYLILQKSSGSSISTPVKIAYKDSIRFSIEIQPILQNKCSPCHFPGGKMYLKMPFDNPATLLSHPDGILKRFKGESNAIIKLFIEQNAAIPR